jgi:hypothetical protein
MAKSLWVRETSPLLIYFSASYALRLLIKKINNIFFSAAFYGILRGIKKGSEIFPETPVIKRCQK